MEAANLCLALSANSATNLNLNLFAALILSISILCLNFVFYKVSNLNSVAALFFDSILDVSAVISSIIAIKWPKLDIFFFVVQCVLMLVVIAGFIRTLFEDSKSLGHRSSLAVLICFASLGLTFASIAVINPVMNLQNDNMTIKSANCHLTIDVYIKCCVCLICLLNLYFHRKIVILVDKVATSIAFISIIVAFKNLIESFNVH